MRRAVATVLILCVVTAGCISPSSNDQEGHPSNALTVETVDSAPTVENVIEYSQMSSGQQEVFVSAVNSEDNDAWIPEKVNYGIWIDYEYVEYNGSFYEVAVSGA